MDDSRDSDIGAEVWNQADDSQSADRNNGELPGENLGMKIVRFLRLYWSKRRMAFTTILAGILISLVYALSRPNIYRSTTSLMPPDNSSPYSAMLGMLSGSSTAASLGSEALGLNTPGELFVSILQSRSVQDALINQFDLMHRYKASVIEDARGALAVNTTIDQDRVSGVITLGVTDKSPDFASKLAQAYVGELNRVVTEDSTSAARRERMFLEDRLKTVKQDLDDSSQALSQFSTRNKAIDLPTQARSMVDAGLRLQQLLAESRGQLAALRQTYSEGNERVKVLEARNAELERQIRELGGTSNGAVKAASSNESVYPPMSELPALGVTYFDLERKVRVDEALWETLTKQYEMAKVQEAKEIPTVRVLDEANVPNRKFAPRRSVMVIIGTLLAMALSCLTVLFSSLWESMDAEDEPKKWFLRVFGRAVRT